MSQFDKSEQLVKAERIRESVLSMFDNDRVEQMASSTTRPFETLKSIQFGELLVEAFEPHGDQVVTVSTNEFQAVCPFSGLPDQADVIIKYVPHDRIIELKALKMFFVSFRNVGIYQEQFTKLLYHTLLQLLTPRSLYVYVNYNVRGGFDTGTQMGDLEFKNL